MEGETRTNPAGESRDGRQGGRTDGQTDRRPRGQRNRTSEAFSRSTALKKGTQSKFEEVEVKRNELSEANREMRREMRGIDNSEKLVGGGEYGGGLMEGKGVRHISSLHCFLVCINHAAHLP